MTVNIKFLERKNNIQCSAILGKIDGLDTECCGAPVHKNNWCKEHHGRYMVPAPKQTVGRKMSLIIRDQRLKHSHSKITETEIIGILTPCGRNLKEEENI